jgi:hypothetical protein
MRVFGAMVISLGLTLGASAEVFVNVYRCDGTTPLPLKDPNTPGVYSDIMVGTRLVFVVSSDAPVPAGYWWWGDLMITAEDWERGKLAGRGLDPSGLSGNYEGSCLEAAGEDSSVMLVQSSDPCNVGLDLCAEYRAIAGDWFVVDYYAKEVGSCDVKLFENAVVDLVKVVETLSETLTFTHVPSCDFNSDHIVNFRDFASLARHWRQMAGADPTAPALPDLDGDDIIGPSDIAQFSRFWLERTDCTLPAAES